MTTKDTFPPVMSQDLQETDLTPSTERPTSRQHRHSRTRPSQGPTVQILSPRAERRMSTTEMIYPDPGVAQEVFENERANNPLHRRVPTPHVSRRRRQRSESIGSNQSVESEESDTTIGPPNDAGLIEPFEPHFGAARGIGRPADAIEVIGLGRKEPRHRKYATHLLKPALRTGPSRDTLHHSRDKPLPNRPASYIVPVGDSSVSSSGFLHVSQPTLRSRPGHSRSHSTQSTGLRGLFSSLTIDPHTGPRPSFSRRGSSKPRELVTPAEDLFTYLRVVELPPWTSWPGEREARRSHSSIGFFGSNTRSKGFDAMPWAWHRRTEVAEQCRQAGRALMSWEAEGKHWEKRICEWLDDNVPTEPIDPANRWGAQIFALPAEGYDSLEFFDEAADQSDDSGLLSWLTGSDEQKLMVQVLQTAVSALHMLRYSSQSFTYHLIPSSSHAPFPTSNHALWDGFGTLALVNKTNELDRAMIIEVRPPSVCDGATMREFAKSGRSEGWWHLPMQYSVGETGQANLLQAQVYDSCVQNQVYFFAVTNLKYWVFGNFNANFTKAWVGNVIDWKQHDPNVMQCLTAWTVRAVDERPRTGAIGDDLAQTRIRPEADALVFNEPAGQSHHQSQSQPTRSRHHSRQDRQSIQTYPQPGFNPSQASFNSMQSYPMTSSPQSPMGEFGQQYHLPGYLDLHPQMRSPPPPFDPSGMGYNTWSAGMPQRAFSPVQQPGPAGYGGGMSWYAGFGWPGMR